MATSVVTLPGATYFDNTINITDGPVGTFITGDRGQSVEGKPYYSKQIIFQGNCSVPDTTATLVTTATGMPPGVSFVDEGSGVLHLEGTPEDSIFTTIDNNDLYSGSSVSTGGIPGSYTLGDTDIIYKEYNVTVTSTNKCGTATEIVPLRVAKNWNAERDAFLARIDQEYPE